MTESNFFYSQMLNILEDSNMPKSFIENFNYIKLKNLRNKIRESIDGFIYWNEANFIVYAGSVGKNSFIGRACPMDRGSVVMDNLISSLDDRYPEFGISVRSQEDISLNTLHKNYKELFGDLTREAIIDKINAVVFLSRYDDINECRIVSYH